MIRCTEAAIAAIYNRMAIHFFLSVRIEGLLIAQFGTSFLSVADLGVISAR